MEKYDVYQQISQRTGGNIQIGVVGPVRTGKSTLIKRFMDLLVMPGMASSWHKQRVTDTLPQSAAGRTIMTTQVQFVPSEAVDVSLSDGVTCSVQLIDCVGYMVDGAMGHIEDGVPRMVRTPWFDEEVSFEVAAETGTRKVIREHATIGLVVTTDGSITEIPRENYRAAEERVISELKELGKPFAVVLNSTHPDADATMALRDSLYEKYDVPVLALDVLHMREAEIEDLLAQVLYEFPVRRMSIDVPRWIRRLPRNHWLWLLLLGLLAQGGRNMVRLRDYQDVLAAFGEAEELDGLRIWAIHPENGTIEAKVEAPTRLYYRVLSEECGCEISDESQLMAIMSELTHAKREYDRMSGALAQVKLTGYGVVPPSLDDLELEEPQLVRRGGQFGVRLRARAPSWHIMQVDIDTEVSPVVGTERQGADMVDYLMKEFEENPASIWKTEFFGKSLQDLVGEGLNQKLHAMPSGAQAKLRNTLSRIVNHGGSGGLLIVFL
ncbi:MAG: stage IV sporulation protein A [Christensenellales bacterium]|jgi:stage IV sporulation protein A